MISTTRWLCGAGALLVLAGLISVPLAEDVPPKTGPSGQAAKTPAAQESADEKIEPKRELLSGKVVLLTEALERRGIKHYTEEIKQQVVLETAAGDLLPIIPDWRGRAFFQDERLRNRATDLVVLRHPGVPHVRVQSIFLFDDEGVRQVMDYWCDVCSIPMYEIKECECCQGPIRLRLQPKELPPEFAKPK